jgi:coenzyme F420 hydrogenase subunit beta
MRGKYYEFEDLKREIIDPGLCTHCGLCIEACPVDVIGTSAPAEGSLPELIGECPACDICVEICPGKTVDFPALREAHMEAESDFSDYLGTYCKIYLGHALDLDVRASGSSGGVITALLLHAKETDKVDGALVLTEEEDRPYQFRSKIVETDEEIRKAAQSKYVIPGHMGTADVTDYRKRLAYVGLPCQIHGIKKLENIRPSWTRQFEYTIGLYCGDTLYFSATAALFKRFGIKDYSQIESVRYREGEWPGSFEVRLKDGRDFSISKYTFNYLSFLYDVDRCHVCTDITAEFADISVGDGWKYESSRPDGGWSIIVTRNQRGEELVQSAIENGDLFVEEVDIHDAVKMHAHSLDNKKIGSMLRIENRQKSGKPVPDYGLPTPNVGIKRRLGERAVAFVIATIRSLPMRTMLNHLPLPWLEAFTYRLREIWKWWSKSNLKTEVHTDATDLLQIGTAVPKETVS